MRMLLQTVSACSLLATVLPAMLFLAGKLDLGQAKWIMLLATIAWFVATPLWISKNSH